MEAYEHKLYVEKAGEYAAAAGKPCLQQFYDMAELEHTSPHLSCFTKYTKHFIALRDLLERVSSNSIEVDDAILTQFDSYMHDIRNYMLLQRGLLVEAIQLKPPTEAE